jgi:hypothetical protein
VSARDGNGVCIDCGLPVVPCRCDEPIGKPKHEDTRERSVGIEVFLGRSAGPIYLRVASFNGGPPSCRITILGPISREQCRLVSQAIEKVWQAFDEGAPPNVRAVPR